MSLSVYTNVASLSAQRSVAHTEGGMQTAMKRLASGLRVNSAKDDAAGLAIANRMEAQIRGMNVAIRNASDAISLAQTAEAALGQATDILQRMRELAVQAANGSNSTSDRANLNTEYGQLNTEINRLLGAVEFNNIAIIGAGAGATVFQVGPDSTHTITVTTVDRSAAAPGGGVATQSAATAAISAIGGVIDTLNTDRATYGAVQSRFESTINTLRASAEAQAAAKGRIMDADFAAETASLTKFQILQQAGVAMISQANQTPQSVLRLLQ